MQLRNIVVHTLFYLHISGALSVLCFIFISSLYFFELLNKLIFCGCLVFKTAFCYYF